MKLLLLSLVFAATAIAAPADNWQVLFDGKSLTGWKATNPDRCWSVKDGMLVGEEDAEKLGSDLRTEKVFKDFVLEAEARWNAPADSGFLFRKDQRVHVQIGMSPALKKDMTASLYLIKAGGYVAEAKVTKVLRVGDWNKFRIEAVGPKYTVWLNGEKVLEHVDKQFLDAGPIGLQCHKETPGMKVEFRNLRVMELPAR